MSATLLSMNLILRYCERGAFSAAVEVGWLCTWKVDCFDRLLKDEPARTPFKFAGERSMVPGLPGFLRWVKNSGRSGKMTVSLSESMMDERFRYHFNVFEHREPWQREGKFPAAELM